MFNKLSLKSLGIIFGGLLVIVVAYMIYDSSHGDRSFRSELVSIDTGKVTQVNIYPKSQKHKLVKLFKDGNFWKVSLSNNENANVPKEKIDRLFSSLLKVKPQGVAASGKKSWKQYQVDTTGTRIVVYQGNDKVLNLIIGKFGFQRLRTMLTYVRVGGDDNVYITEGFLNYEFDHNADFYRDNTVINSEYSNWNKLTFTYPSDSSFTLVKQNSIWEINGKKTDSTETAKYLRSISDMHNSNFIDNPNENMLKKADYTVTIEGHAGSTIIVSAYANNPSVILNSSENPKTFFNGAKNNFWHKLFVGKSHFFKKKKK